MFNKDKGQVIIAHTQAVGHYLMIGFPTFLLFCKGICT